MRRLLTGLTFVFYLFGQVLYADIVVITDSNRIPKYVLDTSTGKTVPVNGVYVEGGETPTPPTPPTPEPPAADKYSAINAKLTKQQGEALTFVLYAMWKENITDTKRAMEEAVGILDTFIKSDGTYDQWLKDTLALGPPKLNEIVVSLAKSFNVSVQDIDTAQSGGTPKQEYAIDIAMIIQLILTILEFLRSIGVLK